MLGSLGLHAAVLAAAYWRAVVRERLAADRGAVRVSLFLPTHRGGPEAPENRIRWKNMLRQVEGTLAGDVMDIKAAAVGVRHGLLIMADGGGSQATGSRCSSVPMRCKPPGSR
jgi:hypothetical protein